MKSVTYRGQPLPFPEQGTWTYDEAALAQRVTGITVGHIAVGLTMGDSRSALAFAVIALQRADIDFDPETIGKTKLDDLIVDFRDEEPEPSDGEDEDDPPADAAVEPEPGAAAASDVAAGA